MELIRQNVLDRDRLIPETIGILRCAAFLVYDSRRTYAYAAEFFSAG